MHFSEVVAFIERDSPLLHLITFIRNNNFVHILMRIPTSIM